MPRLNCAAILLAAGASTRLGRPKQLVQIHGETLLHRTGRLALEAGCSPVIAVLGFAAEQMQAALGGLSVKTIIHPDWQAGMGSSLRCGVEALSRENVPERVLVLVSDQPRLSLEILKSLLSLSETSTALIAASHYAGRAGVPAVFRSPLFPALKSIEGDKGARHVIEQHRHQTVLVDFPEGAMDLDTIGDLAQLDCLSTSQV
jgi:molybdenum cofactor cytidylyltransferase